MSAPGTASRLAAAFTCAIMLVALVVFLSYRPVAGEIVPPGIDPSMASAVRTFDSFGQRLAHKVVLALTALAVLAAVRFGARVTLPTSASRAIDVAIGVGAAGFFLLSARFFHTLDVWGGFPSILTGRSVLFGVIGAVVIALATSHGLRRWLRPIHGFMIAAALAITTLPGFFTPIDLSQSPHVPIMQTHFAIVTTPGDRLAAGLPLFDLVMPQYGIVLPSLVATFERHVRPLSFYDYFLAIRLTQIVYVVVAALLYWIWSRRKLEHILLPLFGSIALFNFNQSGLLTPNQTTWRLMSLPIGLCALYGLEKWRFERAALALGALATSVVLINVETGVSLCFGLAAYAFFRFRIFESWSRLGALAVLAFAGAAFAFGAFLLLFRLGVGTWPAISHADRIFEFLYTWESTGLGGGVFPFDPFPLLIAAHSIYVLVDTALHVRRGHEVPFRRCFLACVATTILIWLAYYVNRPGDWGLRSFYLLYGFFLIDLLKLIRATSLRNRRVRARQVVALLIVATVVIPKLTILATWAEVEVREGIRLARQGPAPGAHNVSGIYLSQRHAQEVIERARFIAERATRERLLYMTVSTVFIPKLSGVEQPLPFGETWVVTEKDYHRLIDRILELDPDVIYFDGPDCWIKGPDPQTAYYERMKKDLSGRYERGAPLSGWEPWRRKPR